MSVAATPQSGSGWPIRLVVVADLTGRGTGLISAEEPVDAVMAALAPELTLGQAGSILRFARQADFAPAQLARLLPPVEAAARSTALDALLHDPRLQALESAWLGLALLVRETRAPIDVVDLRPADLRADPSRPFRDTVGRGPHRPTAILIDADIGGTAGDADLLTRLAVEAERHRVPIVLAAAPSLLGLRHAAHVPGLTDPAARLDAAWGGAWRAFRSGDAARWVVLTFNRYLQRALHMAGDGGHAETASPARPGEFLWGRTVWLAGIDLARSGRLHGHPLATSGMSPERFHLDLPVWSWSGAGGAAVRTSLEATIDAEAAQLLVRSGLSPLIEAAGPGSAVLPLVVNAFRPDPRRIPVEGTLAHTLVLARFVSALADATAPVEAEPDDAAAGGILGAVLRRALIPRFTDGVSATCEAAVERLDGRRVARAALRGDLTLAGRPAEIELSIPLADGPASPGPRATAAGPAPAGGKA